MATVGPRQEGEPGYLALHRSGELARRVERALGELRSCRVCPRDCEVDRLADARKLCHTGRSARVSTYFAHFGEGGLPTRLGSAAGTIFFSWCNLKCVFCQNWETSNEGQGQEVDARQLAGMMLELQDRGCHNINFVTPEHVVPQVLEALPHARRRPGASRLQAEQRAARSRWLPARHRLWPGPDGARRVPRSTRRTSALGSGLGRRLAHP